MICYLYLNHNTHGVVVGYVDSVVSGGGDYFGGLVRGVGENIIYFIVLVKFTESVEGMGEVSCGIRCSDVFCV